MNKVNRLRANNLTSHFDIREHSLIKLEQLGVIGRFPHDLNEANTGRGLLFHDALQALQRVCKEASGPLLLRVVNLGGGRVRLAVRGGRARGGRRRRRGRCRGWLVAGLAHRLLEYVALAREEVVDFVRARRCGAGPLHAAQHRAKLLAAHGVRAAPARRVGGVGRRRHSSGWAWARGGGGAGRRGAGVF